jgi:hypothetical protein
MMGNIWPSWFTSGDEKHREVDPYLSTKIQNEYDKYRKRLTDTDSDVLYDLAALDPDDFYIEELRQMESQRIKQTERIITNAGVCGSFFLNEPSQNISLTNEPSICAGKMIITGKKLPLPISRISNGCAITGLPGSCKTTLGMTLAAQMVLAGVLILAWDLKHTWRKLINFPPLAGKVIVLSILDFMWSLLQPPPGTTAHEWSNRFTKVFAQAFGRISAQRLLREVIDELLRHCPRNCWPVPKWLVDRLKAMRATSSRDRDLISGLLLAITDLERHLPCFDYVSSNFPQCIIDHPGKIVVVEDIGLPVEIWNFVICLMLEYIFTYRRNNPDRCTYDIVNFIDDSTSLCDPGQDIATPGGVSLLAQHLNLSREMRSGIAIQCHSLGQISPKIRCNIENYFCCSLRGDNLGLAQQVLGITVEAAEFMRTNPRGTACSLVPSAWPLPVLIGFPNIMEYLK